MAAGAVQLGEQILLPLTHMDRERGLPQQLRKHEHQNPLSGRFLHKDLDMLDAHARLPRFTGAPELTSGSPAPRCPSSHE